MKTIPRKSVTVIFVVLVVVALIVYAAHRFQAYRVHKIDFVISELELGHITDLSPSELLDYLHACGASTVISEKEIQVLYHGLFLTKRWTISAKSK